MLKLHIEFNDNSLVLSFDDVERIEDVCHLLSRSQKFVYIHSDDNMCHYINTDNILYFYVEDISARKESFF